MRWLVGLCVAILFVVIFVITEKNNIYGYYTLKVTGFSKIAGIAIYPHPNGSDLIFKVIYNRLRDGPLEEKILEPRNMHYFINNGISASGRFVSNGEGESIDISYNKNSKEIILRYRITNPQKEIDRNLQTPLVSSKTFASCLMSVLPGKSCRTAPPSVPFSSGGDL